MASITLKKTLGKGKSTTILLEALLNAVNDPLAILDEQGRLLLGKLPDAVGIRGAPRLRTKGAAAVSSAPR